MAKWDSKLDPHYSTVDSKEMKNRLRIKDSSDDQREQEIMVRSQSVNNSSLSSAEQRGNMKIKLPPL